MLSAVSLSLFLSLSSSLLSPMLFLFLYAPESYFDGSLLLVYRASVVLKGAFLLYVPVLRAGILPAVRVKRHD